MLYPLTLVYLKTLYNIVHILIRLGSKLRNHICTTLAQLRGERIYSQRKDLMGKPQKCEQQFFSFVCS